MDRIDYLAERRTPFIFIISFNKSEVIVEELSNLSGDYYLIIDGVRKLTQRWRWIGEVPNFRQKSQLPF